MLNEPKKYGIKLTIINYADYEDYKEVCELIISKGYKATVVDNGNTCFERVKELNSPRNV